MRVFTVFDRAVNYFPPDTRRGGVNQQSEFGYGSELLRKEKKTTSSIHWIIPLTSYEGGDGGVHDLWTRVRVHGGEGGVPYVLCIHVCVIPP